MSSLLDTSVTRRALRVASRPITDCRSSSLVKLIKVLMLLRVDGIRVTSPKSTSASGISSPSPTKPTVGAGGQLGDAQRAGGVEDLHPGRQHDAGRFEGCCTSRLATWVCSSSGLAVVVSDATLKS